MIAHLIVMAVAAAVSAAATPVVRRIAKRAGAVDVPDDRKVHSQPTPTLGGLALYVATLAALGVAWAMPAFREVFRTSTEPIGVGLAATMVVALGIIDDTRGMAATTKLAGQLVAAGALVLAGVQVFYFWLPVLGVISLSGDMSAVLTVVWTLVVINAINLVDGLDGLAAGVTAIAAIALFVYAYDINNGEATAATLFPAIVVGATLGFLPYNFNPASIFMGDAGSMLLGILLASATVSGVGRTVEPRLSDVAGLVFPVLLPILVLAIPLADVGFAMTRRMRAGTPVFKADKSHIHHWLLEMARSHRQAVLVMYSWSALAAAATMVLSVGVGVGPRIIAVVLAVCLVASILIVPRLLRRGMLANGKALGGPALQSVPADPAQAEAKPPERIVVPGAGGAVAPTDSTMPSPPKMPPIDAQS